LGNNIKQHSRKKHYPSNKKKYYPQKRNNNLPNITGGFFNGNLGHFKFGGNNHDVSGYVERKIYMRDRHGNVQRASEKQFFNSGKQLGRVKIYDDESNF